MFRATIPNQIAKKPTSMAYGCCFSKGSVLRGPDRSLGVVVLEMGNVFGSSFGSAIIEIYKQSSPAERPKAQMVKANIFEKFQAPTPPPV